MQKAKLVHELRERQYKLGVLSKEQIDLLPDDAVILSYTTCSHCGATLSIERLEPLIDAALDTERFLYFVEWAMGKSHSEGVQSVE